MDKKYYTNERSQQIVLALLKAHGIKKVVASPGTTNLTLVASMQQDSWFEMYSSVDERSAAYLACGLAAETGEAVVLSCTGATASRNYMPGLTEAFYRKLPVIAITATQGVHKIGHLNAQVIDRREVPNDIVKMSVDIPVTKTREEERFCEIQVNRVLLEAKHHGGGPVHINLATTYSKDFSVKDIPHANAIHRITGPDNFPILPSGRVAVFVGAHKPFTPEETTAIDHFCEAVNAVVFCDHTSGYNGKYRVLWGLVGCQKDYRSPLSKVDLLIHIGEVSGDYYTTGSIKSKKTWRVSEDGELRDTFGNLACVFEMTDLQFFKHYAAKANAKGMQSGYLQACQNEYSRILQKVPELPFSNLWAASQLSDKLPKDSVLHLGILNSLRSWNMFEVPHSVRTNCNVGGFGIDGGVSSLVGASLANPERLYFGVVGDLAFFYDMNVLGNHHLGGNVRIMLVNNGKGTEFRNYDHLGSIFGNDADKYIAAGGHFGNKSPELIKHYASDLGFEYLTASDKRGFLEAAERFLTPELTNKPILFELFTDSAEESNALYAIKHLEKSVKAEIKKAVKNVLGETGISVIKKIIG